MTRMRITYDSCTASRVTVTSLSANRCLPVPFASSARSSLLQRGEHFSIAPCGNLALVFVLHFTYSELKLLTLSKFTIRTT